METFMTNTLIFLVVVLFIAVAGVVYWMRVTPLEDKRQALKEWLKWAVTLAESELGTGTGQLKLRKVYEMALQQFPWLIKCVSFDEFSQYVDEALVWMRDQIAQNSAIKLFAAATDGLTMKVR